MENSYCAQLATRQVRNVLETEKDRMRRHQKGSSTWNGARDLVDDANNILAQRGEL